MIRPDKMLKSKAPMTEKAINPLGAEMVAAAIILLAVQETRQYIVTLACREEVPNRIFDELSQERVAIQLWNPGAQ